MIDPLSTFAPLVASGSPRRSNDPQQVGKEFEVLLVKQLLDQIPIPALEHTEAGAFLTLVHEALARQLVEQGGLGLADQLHPPALGPAALSSGYGWRRDPFDGSRRLHRGIDLPAAQGAPIGAVRAGSVSFAGQRGGYGNLVVVDHGEGLQTVYGHCDTIAVREGQAVERGAVIGTVGSTGRSTGPHVHFEVRLDGVAVEPTTAGIRPWSVLAASPDPVLETAAPGEGDRVSSAR